MEFIATLLPWYQSSYNPTNLKLGEKSIVASARLGGMDDGIQFATGLLKTQRRVFELVMSYISMQNTTKEDGVSNFPSELCKDDFHLDPVDINTNTLWDWRYKQSLSKMKMVHACRKGTAVILFLETSWLKKLVLITFYFTIYFMDITPS